MSLSVLRFLVCPISKQNLFLLTGERATLIDAALNNGALRYIDGTVLSAEAGRVQFLITENAQHLYSVIDGVPVLLESKQIDPEGLFEGNFGGLGKLSPE